MASWTQRVIRDDEGGVKMVLQEAHFVRDSSQYQYQSPIDAPPRVPHSHAMRSEPEGRGVERALVTVVDDDESVRESLPDLLREFGYAAQAFSSPEEFLASDSVGKTRCLILDVAMPGMNGLDLQRELKVRGQRIPIIFITAQKDEAVRARAFADGAVEFLLKPFGETALLQALNKAIRER